MTKFERRLIRARNKIEKRGQKMAFNAIKSQYKQIYDLSNTLTPQSLLDSISVSQNPINDLFVKYYQMFAPIGLMQRKEALQQKDAFEDEFFESTFLDKLRSLALTESGKKITSITETTEKYIRGAVESAIAKATEEGLNMSSTQKLVRKFLTDSLADIGKSRSSMIAQTEMITASNQASQYAMESTGLNYRKFWSTSGLKDVRDSHQFAEQNYPNGIDKNEYFDMGNGNQMLMVGDPNGAPEEVINCRCTTIYQVVR